MCGIFQAFGMVNNICDKIPNANKCRGKKTSKKNINCLASDFLVCSSVMQRLKPDLHPSALWGPSQICRLSPRGRPTSAAARPPQCGLDWRPGAAASGLGVAVDLKDRNWRQDTGIQRFFENITSTGLLASKTIDHIY